MENGPPTHGLQDGTNDVEHLLGEHQDGNLSMDNLICSNKKTPENAMDMKDVSCSSGRRDTGIAPEGKDILNGEVLDSMPSEAGAGYFRLDNDFCSVGEEYLLSVDFAESITNLDYGSSEGLQASISDSPIQASTAGSGTTFKSDLFDLPSFLECETLVGENPSISPRSCTLHSVNKFCNSSGSSFQDILSDENDERFSPASEMLLSPKTEKTNKFELTARKILQGREALATMSVQASPPNILRTQKRSRKPTKRYIDELVDPVPTYTKKRREVSSSTLKDKSLGVKDHKKCHMGPKKIRQPAEESSVIAIQVPFGSVVHKECPGGPGYDTVQRANSGNLMTKSKGKCLAPQNHNKMEKCVIAVNHKKKDACATIQKKMDGCVNAAQLKRRDTTAASQKKRHDCAIAAIQKKRDDCFAMVCQNKWDDECRSAVHQKKRDDCLTADNVEEVSGRRKHHRLWTISEVRKLIDGVSQYGVGRWSRIKKLFFSASAHRTSVDLKDKWRNLLKASGMQDQGSPQGEKKRNMAWRPLPKSILRRVCELATMYPYPKGQRR